MSKPPAAAISAIGALLAAEATGGFLLMGAAAMALIIANSPWSSPYFDLLHWHIGPLSLLHWINDGLMALFFLLVGLELKRELIEGELSSWQSRALPGAAALAGMIAPALVYIAFNTGHPAALHGWAIPAATDIAFALGVLALLGRHAPVSIKVLLTAIAVVDDLGAILIIAFFYTAGVAPVPLLCAAILLAILITLNRRGVRALWPYLLIGAALWIAVFLSGVHATLAGVATAMAVPLRPAHGKADTGASPLHRLEHKLNPLVAFAILPLFGFANAGVRLIGMGPEAVFGTVPLGIALGLILGKQIGIFGACAGMIRARLAPLPEGANWRQLYGMAILCGIGFTMSLFIGGLAFGEDAPLAAPVKIGVLGGSLVSALLGYLLLRGGRVAPAAAGGE